MAVVKYLKVLGAAFATGFTGAVTPGPMLVAVVALTAAGGFRQAPLIIAGHAITEVAIVLLYWLGLALLIQRGGRRAFLVMKVAGGIVLVGFGVLMAAGARGMTAPGATAGAATPGLDWIWRIHPLLVGIGVSVTNPYFLFWWATVGLGLASQAIRVGRAGPPLFFVGHIHADIVWYLLVGAAVALGRGLLTDTVYRWIVFGGGVFLIGFGLHFALFARWRAPVPPMAASVRRSGA
jgi:threonine/homoserine/homoserine lactone efflux protein